MRNQRLILIAALLLLLVGGGLGAYLVITGSDDADSQRASQHSAAREDGDPENDGAGLNRANTSDSAKPTTDTHHNSKDAAGPDPASTTNKDAGKDTAKTTPVGNDPAKSAIPKVETPPVEEDPTKNWPSKTSAFVITGKVTYKSDARPAVGVAISAEKGSLGFGGEDADLVRTLNPELKIEGATISDGAGEFTLRLSVTRKVPPGLEDSSDEAKGARTMHDPAVYVHVVGKLAGYAPARSGRVELHEGKEAQVKLALSIPAAVSGRVIDAATKAGIEGAEVEFFNADFTERDGDWGVARKVKTTRDGFYSVTDLAAGSYMAGASAEGYSPIQAWQSGKRIDLSKGGEQDVGDMALLKSGALTGMVVDAESNAPVKGATMELAQGGQFGFFPQHSAVTDEAGRFEIKEAPSGQYTLTGKADGYARATIEKVAVESGKGMDVGVIKLGRGFALEGVVTDPQGAGVVGASVTVSERKAGLFGWGNQSTTLGSGATVEGGKFSIGGMVEGGAKVTVTATGYARLEVDVELKAGMAVLSLKLAKGARVSGRVVTSAGAPAASAGVGMIDHAGEYYSMYKLQGAQALSMQYYGPGAPQANTGEDGRFTIESVPAGTYAVLAVPAGGQGVARDGVKVSDDIDLGDIQLPGPGGALIKVTEGGQPVVGLKVELRSGSWAFGGSASHPTANTDSGGAAEFRDLKAGEYLVYTERDKGAYDSELMEKRRINVRTGQTTEFKLELKPTDTVRIHGRLTMDGKARFTEVNLLGYGAREGFYKDTKTDETGFYEFPSVSMGTYVLHARVADKQMTCTVTLALDKAGELEVTRDFSVRNVSGTVSTPANTATERASVRVTLLRVGDLTPATFAQWIRAEARCDADGKFRIEYVPTGNYRLTASLEGVGSVGRDVNISGSDVNGADLAVVANGGTLRVIVKKVHGTLPQTQSFGFVQVKDSAGHMVDFQADGTGFFLPAANTQIDMPTISAGTYTVLINAGGCLPQEKPGVVITKDQRTDLEIEIRVAAELHMTVTNAEITQAMLDAAKVTYHDAQGAEVTKPTSPFDSWNAPAAPEVPTLRTRYIGPTVTQVKVKVAGYVEIIFPIEFEAGKKIEKNETLAAE